MNGLGYPGNTRRESMRVEGYSIDAKSRVHSSKTGITDDRSCYGIWSARECQPSSAVLPRRFRYSYFWTIVAVSGIHQQSA